MSAVVKSELLSNKVPFGLLELDDEGTILYSNLEQSIEAGAMPPPDILGRNLFAEVIAATNIREFERVLTDFNRSGDPTRSFDFTFNFDEGEVPSRVLLAQTREHTSAGERDAVLVHLKKA